MHYQISISVTCSVQEAIDELVSQGLKNIYVIEEKQSTIIGGFTHKAINGLSYGIMKEVPETIDWDAQWAHFAPKNEKNSCLGDLSIQLTAGSGFGDLSHPTTQMMCQLMQKNPLGTSIMDLGCGSGVLGCVGVKCNVKRFYMVDIDPDALIHARQNMQLNGAPNNVIYERYVHEEWLPSIDTILMNMILPNQRLAFKSCPHLKQFQGQWIVSGILKAHESEYLHFINRPFIERLEQDNWLAFIH